jgi:hypothetical protein
MTKTQKNMSNDLLIRSINNFLKTNTDKYSNYTFSGTLLRNKTTHESYYVLERKTPMQSTEEYIKIFGKLPEMKENTDQLRTYTEIFIQNKFGRNRKESEGIGRNQGKII